MRSMCASQSLPIVENKVHEIDFPYKSPIRNYRAAGSRVEDEFYRSRQRLFAETAALINRLMGFLSVYPIRAAIHVSVNKRDRRLQEKTTEAVLVQRTP